MWYKFLGGRKAYQALIAFLGVFGGFLFVPSVNRAEVFWAFILGVLASFGIYTIGNVKEHQVNGDKGK